MEYKKIDFTEGDGMFGCDNEYVYVVLNGRAELTSSSVHDSSKTVTYRYDKQIDFRWKTDNLTKNSQYKIIVTSKCPKPQDFFIGGCAERKCKYEECPQSFWTHGQLSASPGGKYYKKELIFDSFEETMAEIHGLIMSDIKGQAFSANEFTTSVRNWC